MRITVPSGPEIHGGNYFTNWYQKEVKKNKALKQRIVEENPELAIRIHSIFGDSDIVKLFVQQYGNDSDYNATAYFISGGRIGRIGSPLDAQIRIDRNMGPDLEEIGNIHVCGNNNPSGNFWMENQWDNIVRLMEDTR